MKKFIGILGLVLLLGVSVFTAGVPNIVSFQGRLTDAAGVVVPDGTVQVTFRIYDAAVGGTVQWNSGAQPITTVDGVFDYDLGSNIVLPDLFGSDTIRYLGITVGADSEIIPRTRFTSIPYVFRSAISDLALDADSLGGLQPAFYLDWGNLTNIPAGFADGVDDGGGISEGEGDARYIEKLGDRLNGDLVFDGNSDGVVGGMIEMFPDAANFELSDAGQVKSKIWGELYGEMRLYDESGDVTAALNATGASGGRMVLGDGTGATTIYIDGGLTGDGSVLLSNDAINSAEMLEEPGIVQGRSTAGITISDLGIKDLTTVTITIPTSGYIFLQGRTTFLFSGTTSINWAILQIDETLAGNNIIGVNSLIGFFGYATTGGHFLDCSAQRTYFKSAGTYTFRLEAGRANFSNGSAECYYPILTAFFIPTSYGSVNTIAEIPSDHPDAKKVTITGRDGNTHTVYEMDLRYYEEKTRAARIAKQKAELAEAEAELELARAKRQQDTND